MGLFGKLSPSKKSPSKSKGKAVAPQESALPPRSPVPAKRAPAPSTPGRNDIVTPERSVKDKINWLEKAFNKDGPGTPSTPLDLEGFTNLTLADRQQWLEEKDFRKHLEERGVTKLEGSNLVSERKQWLLMQDEKTREINEKNKVIHANTPVGKPKDWLEEKAFRTHLEDGGMMKLEGSSLVEERTKWLVMQVESEPVGKPKDWLEEKTFRTHVLGGNNLVAERRKWLIMQDEMTREINERNKVRHANKPEGEPKEWLAETAFRKHLEDNGLLELEGSNLVEERRKWLLTQGTLAGRPKDWLEEKDFRTHVLEGSNLVAERKKWLLLQSERTREFNERNKVTPMGTPRKLFRKGGESGGDGYGASGVSGLYGDAGGYGGGTAGKELPCLWSSPFFAEQREQTEFFLPKACACKKCREESTADDPNQLATLFRPWQEEFLRSEGIASTEQLVQAKMEGKEWKGMSKTMKAWRKERGLPAKKIGCLLALHIWSKTAEQLLRNAAPVTFAKKEMAWKEMA